jgi:hypothetical protein
MTTFSVIPGPEAAWPLEEPGIQRKACAQRIPDRLAADLPAGSRISRRRECAARCGMTA